jgi:drug/metabolite transporter (DMT)-like permease
VSGGVSTGGSGSALATGPIPGRGWTDLSLLLMVLVWGVNFSVVKWALDTFPPLGFNALRFVLASLFVLAVLRLRGPLPLPRRQDVRRLVLLGVAGNVLYQLGFIYGLTYTRAGNASVVMALTPVFIALLSSMAGHELHRRRVWLGAACSVVGVALVTGGAVRLGDEPLAWLGDLLLVGAGGVWALYTVGARPLIERYGAVAVTAWTLWVGTGVLVLIGIPDLLAQEWAAVSPAAWGGLFYSAVLSIGLAYLIWYGGVARIGNTRTAIYSNLTPLVALATAALWLGEAVTPLTLAGVALTLGGVMVVRSS